MHFQLPFIAFFIALKHIDISIIGANFKIQIIRTIPPVDYIPHLEFCFSKNETDRPFMGRISGIAGNLKFDALWHDPVSVCVQSFGMHS
jgi:hypothetical protein